MNTIIIIFSIMLWILVIGGIISFIAWLWELIFPTPCPKCGCKKKVKTSKLIDETSYQKHSTERSTIKDRNGFTTGYIDTPVSRTVTQQHCLVTTKCKNCGHIFQERDTYNTYD